MATNTKGETCLHIAVKHATATLTSVLCLQASGLRDVLPEQRADVMAANTKGETCLHTAIKHITGSLTSVLCL